MKKVVLTTVLVSSLTMLSGCANNGPNEDIGIGVGALAGGLIGSTIGGGSGKVIATAVGAVGGALVGSAVGRNMDESQGYDDGPPPPPYEDGDYYGYGY